MLIMSQKAKEILQKGYEIIEPKFHADWEKRVNVRMAGLYQGADLKCALDIIKQLNAGASFEDVKQIVASQNHIFSSYGTTMQTVAAFCERGRNFVDYDLGRIPFEPTQGYREMFFGGTLDSVVTKMQELENRGFHVSTDFNGHMLYSDTVTIDSAYKEVLGCTKAEWDKQREEFRRQQAIEEARFEAQKPELIAAAVERGAKLIEPELMGNWKNYVEQSYDSLYKGYDVIATLDLLEAINQGQDWKEVKQIFEDQGHSGCSASLVGNTVQEFSGCEGVFDYLVQEGKEPSVKPGGLDDQNFDISDNR